MQMRRLTIYGAIAVATPLLVLTNTLLSSADRALTSPAISLQPLLEKTPRLYPAAQSLAMAYRAWMVHPYARIVADHNQFFLEFYAPFNLLGQGPDLSLVLVTASIPVKSSGWSQQALPLGKVHAKAGRHRYPIPVPVSEPASAYETIRQYQSVIIWCAEMNAMVAYAQIDFEVLATK